MGYNRRKPSEVDIYHIIVRGSGKQLIFEDDKDRETYLSTMRTLLAERPVEIYAWCLMGNHVHLLVHAGLQELGLFMRDLGRDYSQYFNRRHGRVGHLMQGRYRSIPVDTEAQLLAVVRYIHRNPVKSGLSEDCRYRWSSYGEYLGGRVIVEHGVILSCFGSVSEFERFHNEMPEEGLAESHARPLFKMTDEDALRELRSILDESGLASLPLDDGDRRDEILVLLHGRGMSIRQVARIAGVGKYVAEKACRAK